MTEKNNNMGLPSINVTFGLDKLVEAIANATGLTALGIIKNARGKAEAQSILARKKAESDAEVEILRMQGEEKVAQYVLARNNQKIENVGEIIAKAEQHFTPDEEVSSEPVDKDWMTRFLDIAETISDDEMRDLWARVLAGEVKKPKSYSLRTLEVLRNISKEEAETIVKVSTYLLGFDVLCIEDFALKLHEKILLDDIGIVCGEDLIRTYPIHLGKCSFALNRQYQMNIYAPENAIIQINCIKLTRAGSEIIKLIQGINYNGFISALSSKLKQNGATKNTINQIVSWNGDGYQYLTQEIEV